MPSPLFRFVKVLSRLIGINVAYTSICLYYFQAIPLAIHPINGYKSLSTFGLKTFQNTVQY